MDVGVSFRLLGLGLGLGLGFRGRVYGYDMIYRVGLGI